MNLKGGFRFGQLDVGLPQFLIAPIRHVAGEVGLALITSRVVWAGEFHPGPNPNPDVQVSVPGTATTLSTSSSVYDSATFFTPSPFAPKMT